MRIAPDVAVPVDDIALAINGCGNPRNHGRTVGLPRVLLLSHPLHANRLAWKRARNQCGITSCIVGGVVTVAARAFYMDDMNALDWQLEHFRDGLPVRIYSL